MSDVTVDWIDKHQLQRLDEMLIVVDENDRVIGADTKRNCHQNENIEKGSFALSTMQVSLPASQSLSSFFSPPSLSPPLPPPSLIRR